MRDPRAGVPEEGSVLEWIPPVGRKCLGEERLDLYQFDICRSEPGQEVAAARCVVNVVAVPGHSKWEAALLTRVARLASTAP